jgi:hypothetical protein
LRTDRFPYISRCSSPVDDELFLIFRPSSSQSIFQPRLSLPFISFSPNSCAVFDSVCTYRLPNSLLRQLFTFITTSTSDNMLFKSTLLFSLAVSALALPAPKKDKAAATTSASAVATTAASAVATAAASAAAGTGASVLTVQDYADFQVSDGVAGDALNEVNAKFPVSSPKYDTVKSYSMLMLPPD